MTNFYINFFLDNKDNGDKEIPYLYFFIIGLLTIVLIISLVFLLSGIKKVIIIDILYLNITM